MERTTLWLALVWLTLLLLGGCADDLVFFEEAECDNAPDTAHEVLTTYCHSCHGKGGSSEGGINYIVDLIRMVESGLVVPGSAADSKIYQVVESGYMPDDPFEDLSVENKETIRRWIECGAEPLQEEERRFITPKGEIDAMLQDLQQNVPDAARPFTRYLTLVHLYNAGVLPGDLKSHRGAVAKLLLSLAKARVPDPLVPVVVPLDEAFEIPDEIEESGLIFRIDLREYGLTYPGVDAWERALRAYPYGIYYREGETYEADVGNAGRTIAQASQELRDATHSRLPFVNADWFASATTLPPLYYEVTDLPRTVDEFLLEFGLRLVRRTEGPLCVQDDALGPFVGPPLGADCAGFEASGVSLYNRVITRQSGRNGYCWVSFDFDSSVGGQNIFAHPTDFAEDGGEMFCATPSGQQIYFVANARGERLDRGPIAVVDDPNQEADENGDTVATGISCMRCHSNGIIPKDDEIRSAVEQNPQLYNACVPQDVVQNYTDVEDMRQLQDTDRAAFDASLEAIGVDPSDPEPIVALVGTFDIKMDLRRIAAELRIESSRLEALLEDNPAVAVDVPQLRSGGVIDREVFDGLFANLLCAYDIGACSGVLDGCGASDIPCWGTTTCQTVEPYEGACQ